MLKLLLPVDGSDNALRAVKHAVDSQTWYREPPEYHLLNVQSPIASGAVKMFISQRQLDDYYFSRTATPQTPFNRAKAALYGPALMSQLVGTPPDTTTRELLARVAGQPLLNRMLYVDTKSWLPDDLLVKAPQIASGK